MAAKRDKHRQALWDKWQTLTGEAADALRLHIDELFYEIRQSACDQLSEDASRFSRMGTSDENIYTHLADIMSTYHKAVKVASRYRGSPTVYALLYGLCEVLNSRLREFDEVNNGINGSITYATDDISEEDEENETSALQINPIALEKHSIVDGAIAYTARQIHNYATEFAAQLQTTHTEKWNSLCMGLLGVGEFVPIELTKSHPEIYNYYKEGLRFALNGLDDLHVRKMAHFYMELIGREWEELSNIIHVQVLALERTDTQVSDPIVQNVLNPLRQVYQKTGSFMLELKSLQTQQQSPKTVKNPLAREFDVFSVALSKSVTNIHPTTPTIETFFRELYAETDALYGLFHVEFMKAAYQLQREISAELLLAEEVTEAFEKAVSDLINISAYLTNKEKTEINTTDKVEESDKSHEENQKENEIQKSIFDGVVETIEIKVESLHESIKTFNKEGLELIKAFSDEKPNIPDEQREIINSRIRNVWLSTPPADFEDMDAFFEVCMESDIFNDCRMRVQKQVCNYIEKAKKIILRFDKEVVLYEICTYEEILTHSVSRLRDSITEEISHAVEILDRTSFALEVILKKNNITAIRPEPHDLFNAQEHEVLVAEKMDGFNKGEIIKMINSGYRQKDQVLLRANVIAAR